MNRLFDLIARDTTLKRTSAKHGGEYSGPCPLCRQGTDRFKVWPQLERWACLGYKHGRAGCGRSGDIIQYLRERDGLGYREACARLGLEPAPHSAPGRGPQMLTLGVPAPLVAPSARWQEHGRAWVDLCAARLWQPDGGRALAWLRARGLHDDTLRAYSIGYNPTDRYEPFVDWGLPEAPHGGARAVWLPRGIVIPWFVEGALWRINVRRPLSAAQRAEGQAKYVGPAGFANGLYNAGGVDGQRPVVLVEGEFDALTVQQVVGDRAVAVATGSTCGSRPHAWTTRLAKAPLVIVAFDVDANGAGDRAADWWLRMLPNAVRWLPLSGDVNEMAVEGFSVAQWVEEALVREREDVDGRWRNE